MFVVQYFVNICNISYQLFKNFCGHVTSLLSTELGSNCDLLINWEVFKCAMWPRAAYLFLCMLNLVSFLLSLESYLAVSKDKTDDCPSSPVNLWGGWRFQWSRIIQAGERIGYGEDLNYSDYTKVLVSNKIRKSDHWSRRLLWEWHIEPFYFFLILIFRYCNCFRFFPLTSLSLSLIPCACPNRELLSYI